MGSAVGSAMVRCGTGCDGEVRCGVLFGDCAVGVAAFAVLVARFGRFRGVGWAAFAVLVGPFRVRERPRIEDLQGGSTRISSGSMMVIVQVLLQSHHRDGHVGALCALRVAGCVCCVALSVRLLQCSRWQQQQQQQQQHVHVHVHVVWNVVCGATIAVGLWCARGAGLAWCCGSVACAGGCSGARRGAWKCRAGSRAAKEREKLPDLPHVFPRRAFFSFMCNV
jgi:hypothetical protein